MDMYMFRAFDFLVLFHALFLETDWLSLNFCWGFDILFPLYLKMSFFLDPV